MLVALALLAGLLSGCGETETASVTSQVQSAAAAETAAVESALEESSAGPEEVSITEITLNGDNVSIEGSGAKADGSVVTITQAGKYQLRGTLTDGQIIVDADKEDEVCLLLSGVDITCTSSAPIYVKQAKEAGLELDHGTENTITDTANYVFAQGEDEPDAAIFSKDDLVLCGAGSLTVNGNYNMAVHSKDTLTVDHSGTYNLSAVGDGIKGKDEVVIQDGTINIDAGEDGIQANNDKDADMGNVLIEGGNLNITAGKHGVKAESALVVGGEANVAIQAQEDGLHATGQIMLGMGEMEDGYVPENDFALTIDAQQDGVQAGGALNVSGGTIGITTAGGAANAPEHTERFGFPGWFDTTDTQEDAASAKGFKSDGDITISGGTVSLDSMDDAIHCGGKLTVSDSAELTIATGDDALHSDDTLTISGGKIHITQSYEGLEAVFIEISGGETTLVASDDGLNAAGGKDADTDFPFMGPPGFGGAAETLEDATYYVHITGGILNVDAGGDGLDSNGALFVDGGEVYVSGPSDSMNGGLDYTTTGQVNGGTVVVAGASGMAQNFDSSSTQASLMYTFSTNIEAGSQVTLTDSAGTALVDTTMAKGFNNVVISLPALIVGETYTLTCGTETVEVTLTDTITSQGSGGFGMGPGGGPGGPGGGPGGPPR